MEEGAEKTGVVG